MKKVKLVFFLFMGLAASACGREPKVEIDAELQSYVAAFEQNSVEVGSPVVINDLVAKFGKLDNPRTNGICEIKDDESPTVIISREKWDRMDEKKRESLVYHELGHCVLGRKHQPGIKPEGIPESVMNPYSIDSEIYSENREYYVHELFHQSAQ